MSKKKRTPQQHVIRWLLPPVLGAGFGALAVFLSQLLIKNLDKIVRTLANTVGASEAEIAPVMAMLGTFSRGTLTSPWLPVILTFAALALICVTIWRIKPLKWLILTVINIVLLTFILLPTIAASVMLTDLNGVSLGATMEKVIAMLGMMLK